MKKPSAPSSCLAALLASALLLLAGPARAQDAGADDLVIGASLPLSGPNAAAGQEGLAVLQAVFDATNKAGGVQGRHLSLRVLDDGFDPARAADNARQLAADGRVLALLNCWGTASCSAMMPVITEQRLPLVSGIAGGGPMRSAPGRYAFNVRAGTDDEIARMVRQMKTVGQNRIAVVYQDDPFGKSGLAAAQAVLTKAASPDVVELALAPDGANAAAVSEALRKAEANGVILVASPTPTVRLITQARRGGLATPFYNLAAQANRKVAAELGEHTAGVIFTTLVPSPWRDALPVVREYQHALGASGDYSYAGLEVFINAKVLLEGLRKAGRSVTREGLVTALESMGEKQYGGLMSVQYGPGDRAGSSYVGLAIVNRQGRFVE